MINRLLRTLARLTLNELIAAEHISDARTETLNEILGTKSYVPYPHISDKGRIKMAIKGARRGWFEMSLTKADMPASGFYRLTKVDAYIYKKELAEKWETQ